jgi:hypothetical protein
MTDENASTLGQYPRIDGKGKIAKVPIFAVRILSVGPHVCYKPMKILCFDLRTVALRE